MPLLRYTANTPPRPEPEPPRPPPDDFEDPTAGEYEPEYVPTPKQRLWGAAASLLTAALGARMGSAEAAPAAPEPAATAAPPAAAPAKPCNACGAEAAALAAVPQRRRRLVGM